LWSFFACLQAVARERELKTFDFQRTTTLTSGELLVGKLFGAPIAAWFIFALCFPAVIIGAVAGGFTFGQVFLTYVLTIIFAIFLGLGGLLISTWMERPRTGAAVFGVLFLLWIAAMSTGEDPAKFSDVPGFFGFSPFLSISQLYSNKFHPVAPETLPTIFGHPIEWFWISVLLYVSFGAWIVVMLRRNLKRDWDELRLLSRWQALGFVIFINFLLYAFLNLPAFRYSYNADDRYEVIITANAILLYWIGIIALSQPERLKVWARLRHSSLAGLLTEDGLVWPWLVLTAVIGAGSLAVYVFAAGLNETNWSLARACGVLFTVLVFGGRDLLFLQWCTLTRMRRPVVKGVIFLLFYYISAGVIIGSSHAVSSIASWRAAALLTPFAGLDQPHGIQFPITGVVIQLALISLLLNRIAARLRRSSALFLAQAA
jgi:hypothetical protein